ncbi:MAG: hypothetical protein WCW25_00175 [Patescibacteria group bacterium]|jgi:hypothetical protein
MPQNLTSIPRVESKAPLKNTIEWEIPDRALASLLLVNGIGYMFIVKVKKEKKHWWEKTWKTFSKRAADPATAVLTGLDFLEKNGYTIDSDSIEFGEQVGAKNYFNNNQHNSSSSSKENKDLDFFKNRVLNFETIEKNGGSLPIQGWQIGQILINEKSKEAKIEIRQTGTKDINEKGAWYHVPFYGFGHLTCENIEYKKVDTDINGGIFLLFQDKSNQNKIKLMLNHNRQGIEIVCDKVSVTDFKDANVGIEEFKELDIGSKIGRFFKIIVE